MNLDNIMIADFKAYFYRDFPYLPVWSASTTYKINNIVYYETDTNFYKCIVLSTGNLPTDTNYFELDSNLTVDDYIRDEDITKAFGESKLNFNQALFTSDANITIGYQYLTAHYLCYDIRTSKVGVLSVGEWNMNKRVVGNVREDYYIPESWVGDSILNFYTKTGYGLKYLNLVTPKLVGHVGILEGTTLPSWTRPGQQNILL